MTATAARRLVSVPDSGLSDDLERELRRMAVLARLEATRRHSPRPAGHFVRPAVGHRRHASA